MSKHVLCAAALAFIAVAAAPTVEIASAQGAGPGAAMSRADATGIIRELRRIVTPNGIERAETIRIGGIDQFVTIRGTDRRNPVLLILHGGPGFPEAALAWWNTRALEEYFVVVHWDQRGSGKTHLINDPQAVAPTMDPEHFIDDTEELVGWLRRELDKKKVFVLGHSWGSYIGLEFAVRRPEWLHAYIGTGQATNTPESERRGWAFALAEARRTGNAQAIEELMSIAPYAVSGAPIPLDDIMIERRWSDYFGGVMAYRTGQSDGIAARLSPDYTDAEAARVFEGNGYSQNFLFSNVVTLDLSRIRRLRCPLILLEGRHDRTVNSDVAYEWFQRVRAPEKHFVWFEHSAHEVMSEEPGRVLISLVRYARPIAERAGDAAP
ncbi:alpha/beta fold hydrolase [Sphingomonas sp. DT-204]|uniref:alpha/beta fold hydrolase n=1 Tax=Sphingomonas sp. DT-204 TaxID=3396166 RepID=UPI003F196AFD